MSSPADSEVAGDAEGDGTYPIAIGVVCDEGNQVVPATRERRNRHGADRYLAQEPAVLSIHDSTLPEPPRARSTALLPPKSKSVRELPLAAGIPILSEPIPAVSRRCFRQIDFLFILVFDCHLASRGHKSVKPFLKVMH